jgi:methylmalonyl-CoA/ethylmalonyl-CoA epimerase
MLDGEMMIKKIDHVGIAVSSLNRRLPIWAEALGLSISGMETVDDEHVKVAFMPLGESTIELLEATGDSSAVAKFIRKRGEGMHHLALEAEHLETVLEVLRSRGVKILGGGQRDGAGGSKVAFLHPEDTGGVLIELVESKPAKHVEPLPEIQAGSAVLVYLQDPQEKLWGLLRRLDSAGAMLQGIDLSSFDDWISQIDHQEESVVGPSLLFVPMRRIEKMLLDHSSGNIPSLAERFHGITGRTVHEVLGEL